MIDFVGFKKLMSQNAGESFQEKLFACPADKFHYSLIGGAALVAQGIHEQTFSDHSSYGFNGATGTNLISGRLQSIAGMKVSSIKDPAKTLLVFEIPAIVPYSWHEPKRRLSIENAVFNDAKNMASFVDGHVKYISFYWNSNRVTVSGISYITDAVDYDPPARYEYKWSGK